MARSMAPRAVGKAGRGEKEVLAMGRGGSKRSAGHGPGAHATSSAGHGPGAHATSLLCELEMGCHWPTEPTDR